MAAKYNDFSALRGIKKELEVAEQDVKASAAQPKEPPRRSHTVQLPSRYEEHARNIGIEKGSRVRLMDTNDTGTIVGVGKDYYEIDLSGLTIRATRSEFVLVDADQDRRLYASVTKAPKKHAKTKVTASPGEELVVDLHLERIPGSENVPEWAALDYQMGWFRKILRDNLKHRGCRIVFIHGDGDGTLKAAIRKELDEVYAISCTYSFGNADNYGTGATVVTVR